jgi:hypothetical protein
VLATLVKLGAVPAVPAPLKLVALTLETKAAPVNDKAFIPPLLALVWTYQYHQYFLSMSCHHNKQIPSHRL